MKILFSILFVLFCSTSICAQELDSKWRLLVDITPLQVSLGNLASDAVIHSPNSFQFNKSKSASAEITVLRNYDQWAWGIGVSTSSYAQSLFIDYSLVEPGEQTEKLDLNFYRHSIGIHAYIQKKFRNLELGLRQGVYYPFAINTCPQNVNFSRVSSSSEFGKFRTDLKTSCYQEERTWTLAMTELEIMIRLKKNFWTGFNLAYYGWASQPQSRLYQFTLHQDSGWNDGSQPIPLVNDISVHEPWWQLGLCLRYNFQLSTKNSSKTSR